MEKDKEQKILDKIDFEEKWLTEEFIKGYISLADAKTALNEIRQEVIKWTHKELFYVRIC